jgi:hypothetical protein
LELPLFKLLKAKLYEKYLSCADLEKRKNYIIQVEYIMLSHFTSPFLASERKLQEKFRKFAPFCENLQKLFLIGLRFFPALCLKMIKWLVHQQAKKLKTEATPLCSVLLIGPPCFKEYRRFIRVT